MARGKGKIYSAEQKTKIVLELLKEEKTANELASEYGITSKTITNWKKQFLENASIAFEPAKVVSEYKQEIKSKDEEIDELYKRLGKATVERDWAVGKLESLDLSNKKELIESEHKTLSVANQCEILGISRSSYYYKPKPIEISDIKIMNEIDKIYTDYSFYGYRRIYEQLVENGYNIGINRVLKLMNMMGIQAIFPKAKKQTSIKAKEHKIYPYLLRGLEITRANQVWSSDITYIPTHNGFIYLCAIIDWHTRSILSYRISNTMDTILVTDTLKDALAKYPKPEIFNTDQGSQYTCTEHTTLLKENGIQISMNGKGRSIDNIAIERFFRTLKYENIYINDYQSIKELKEGINKYIHFYNFNRFHSAINYSKPMNLYQNQMKNVA